jgi:hypothetical protein
MTPRPLVRSERWVLTRWTSRNNIHSMKRGEVDDALQALVEGVAVVTGAANLSASTRLMDRQIEYEFGLEGHSRPI